MLRRRAQNEPEQPSLNFHLLRNFPFEYILIPPDSQSLAIQKQVGKIRSATYFCRIPNIFYLAAPIAMNLNKETRDQIINLLALCAVSQLIPGVKKLPGLKNFLQLEDSISISWSTISELMTNIFAPSAIGLIPQLLPDILGIEKLIPSFSAQTSVFSMFATAIFPGYHTKKLGDMIKEEMKQNNPGILGRYHYLIVDNAENIVLFRHPEKDHKHLNSPWLEKKFHAMLMQWPVLRTKAYIDIPATEQKAQEIPTAKTPVYAPL